MREKGIDALEIVFAMFILIVVTLVIIRLFTTTVSRESLPNIDDFRSAYNYDKEKSHCNNDCSAYTSNGCSDLAAAVTFCQERISVDIDGNFKTNEKGHGGLIAGIPYCEDGLYCFHITECGCGSFVLTPEQCLIVMKDYYVTQMGLSEQTADQIIVNKITPGTCAKNPADWGRKFYEGYTAIKPTESECKVYNLDYPCYLPADWWYWKAGYGKIAEAVSASVVQSASVLQSLVFSCASSDGNIRCNWLGCPASSDVIVFLSDGDLFRGKNQPTGTFTFGPKQPGSYSAVLVCGEKTSTYGPISVQ